jgi:tetratricopeptide (TPR) repeat protein
VTAQERDNWTGKRVVQKSRNFVLLMNDEPVERSGKALDFYTVEQIDGPALFLNAQRQGTSGWADAAGVVPVENAIDFFTEQIRARPRDAFSYAMRALVHHDKKEINRAVRDYNQAIKLDPRDPLIYCGRGCVWQSRKEYEKAIADFDEAIRLDPKNAVAYVGRGTSRAARKEYTRAIADYSEAIWLDPLSIAAYENRGAAWHSKGEYEKAIVDYNLAIRLDPQHAVVLCRRAQARAARKEYHEAIADFNEAIRLDPQYPVPYSDLAWLLATCADSKIQSGEKAVQAARKACELTQWRDAARLDTLAAACAAAGDFESAVKWQTQASALDPGGEIARERDARTELYRRRQPYRQSDP